MQSQPLTGAQCPIHRRAEQNTSQLTGSFERADAPWRRVVEASCARPQVYKPITQSHNQRKAANRGKSMPAAVMAARRTQAPLAQHVSACEDDCRQHGLLRQNVVPLAAERTEREPDARQCHSSCLPQHVSWHGVIIALIMPSTCTCKCRTGSQGKRTNSTEQTYACHRRRKVHHDMHRRVALG